ncbi:MAG: hypothetical protein MUO64_18605 [Anaerolineales bacterium]|nr:hypothetical protein [Anaerolineales bacterium]
MITIFSCPKPFQGHINIIQRNAIKSWTLLNPKPEIILLGDDLGVAEICREFNLVHIPGIEKNQYGTPLVSSIFQCAQEVASYSVVCYVNADIILMSDFISALKTVSSRMSKFLLTGQRWNVDISKVWDFDSPDWESSLCSYVDQNGELYSLKAIDYIVFPRGMYTDIPPFALGRFLWDNWLIYHACKLRVPIVDATASVKITHQNHGYAPHIYTKIGGRSVKYGPEGEANLVLAGYQVVFFGLGQANWELSKLGLIKRNWRDSLICDLLVRVFLINLSPRISDPLLRAVRRVLKPIKGEDHTSYNIGTNRLK